MRRAWHLLLLMSVLWCGLHCGGPAQAEGLSQDALEYALHAADEDGHGAPDAPLQAIHAGHHHCALAPCKLSDAPDLASLTAGTIPVAHAVQPLDSLAQAPPVDPPSA
jgi:hypothetical protein